MCGRFSLTSRAQRLRDRFALAVAPDEIDPRYNIAPTQPVLVIPNRTRRMLRPARWGLIPNWAKEQAIGQRMINARAETLTTRSTFRAALERRRCLIPADGFYEWQRDGRQRAPFYIHRRDGEPFAFAGLWDVWYPPDADPIASCTIITTQPNDVVAELHDRMPVILPAEAYDAWLTPAPLSPDALLPLLVPFPSGELEAYAVSPLVNSPNNEEPGCIVPAIS